MTFRRRLAALLAAAALAVGLVAAPSAWASAPAPHARAPHIADASTVPLDSTTDPNPGLSGSPQLLDWWW